MKCPQVNKTRQLLLLLAIITVSAALELVNQLSPIKISDAKLTMCRDVACREIVDLLFLQMFAFNE